MFLDLDSDCSGKRTQVHGGDYNSRDIGTFEPLLNTIIYAKKISILFRFWQVQNCFKTLGEARKQIGNTVQMSAIVGKIHSATNLEHKDIFTHPIIWLCVFVLYIWF